MTVVDSSVWIDLFNGRPHSTDRGSGSTAGRPRDGGAGRRDRVYEVLAGFRSQAEAERNRFLLENLILVSMLDFELVPRAVANYQALRRRGVTIGTVDMIIGTYCLEAGAAPLTADRGFTAMRDHLGLRPVE
jgi:predicted nucleic acid-binding protein